MDGFVAALPPAGPRRHDGDGLLRRRDLPFYWNVADRVTCCSTTSSASARVGAAAATTSTGWPASRHTERRAPAARGLRRRADDLRPAAATRGVPWKFYVENLRPRGELPHRTPESTIRVPLLGFARFLDDPRLAGHVVDLSEYYRDLDAGTLPSVAYVVANGSSEHPPARLDKGQDLVRDMTGELAKSRYWSSSAFLWTYERRRRVVRPRATADGRRRRLRVPGAGAAGQPVRATRATWTTPRSTSPSILPLHRGQLAASRRWARVTQARRDSARRFDFASPAASARAGRHRPDAASGRTHRARWVRTTAPTAACC